MPTIDEYDWTISGKFTIGQAVYRVKWDKVEAGKVTLVEKCRFGSGSTPFADPNGESNWVHASFGKHDYLEQTSDHRFFNSKKKGFI